MEQPTPPSGEAAPLDPGLRALSGIAAYYRIGADPNQIRRELALGDRASDDFDLIRAAQMIGLKARLVSGVDEARMGKIPTPAIVRLRNGALFVFGGRNPAGLCRLVDPISHATTDIPLEELRRETDGRVLLVARRIGGAGISPKLFGLRWFLPTLWRYRKPLGHVLAASLFVQLFALTTPLIFQVIVDKVLTHRGYETLFVMIAGLVVVSLFDVVLQYLRAYALSHTTNRIDVELGQRLFAHLLRLPMSYFETRSAGQTVARVRELETIRAFLTGQGLFSAIDLVFTVVFFAVMFAYSVPLTLITLIALPVYILIGFTVRPPLRDLINEKFNRGAASQQFLVETIVGVGTIKSAAVEPIMRAQWEEKLAAYVKTSFSATMLGTGGQLGIQYVSKLTTAAILLFGAKAVIDGELSVGALVAFNMIASQAVQPILRLSQIWQDFQQVQISIERLGDILNAPPEPAPTMRLAPPTPRGAIEFRNISFRYRPGGCGRSEERLAQDRTGRDDWRGRPVGLRQVDPDQARATPLPSDRGPGLPRRRRSQPGRSGVAAQPHRRGAAGEPAVQPDDPREHRLLRSRDAEGEGDRDRPPRRRRRVHRQAPGRVRHHGRGARREPVRRTASAHRDRTRARHQSAHPYPRRGDLGPGLRERAHHPAQYAPHRQGQDGDHRRPSAGGSAGVRPHCRHGRRTHR